MRAHVVDWLQQFMPHHIAALVAPSWFTLVGLAGVVSLFWMLRVGRREGIPASTIANLIIWPYVAAVVGGIAIPMLVDSVEQFATTGRVRMHWAGMTSFWGYLCGLGALVIVCRRSAIPLARLADLATPALGISLTLARIGCFLAGCDFGKVTSLPWAMRFPTGSPAWHEHVDTGLMPASRIESLPVHPTQLYEAAIGVVICVAAILIARTAWARAGRGRVALAGVVIYSIGRIGIEALRGDSGRGIYAGLSSGQIFSLVVLAVIALSRVWPRRRVMVPAVATAATLLLAIFDAPDAAAQPAGTTAPAATEEADSGVKFTGGVLMGVATPLNRRMEQVGALAGPTISIGVSIANRFGIWFDFDSYGNRDASHGTAMLSGSAQSVVSPKVTIGARMGIGATLVNFDDDAFRDVTGTTVRFESTIEYELGSSGSWALWARPLSFDILTAKDLGGPITTYQFRVGLGYRFGVHRKAEPPAQKFPDVGQPGFPAPNQPGYPQPGQPGYPMPGQPGYGQPGTVYPQPYQPGQPGYPTTNPYPGQPGPNPGQPGPNPGPPTYVPPTQPTNPPQPAAGAERGVCKPNNACDAGLTCASNRCVRLP